MGAVLMLLGGKFKLLVSLEIKVCKEDNERKHVADLEACPPYGKSTGPHHGERGVGHGEEELDKLQLCEIFLPPQIRPHGWNRRQAVVGVHHDVDETVESGTKEGMATGNPVHDEPPDVEHGSVMINVEKCDLVIVLS